MHSTKGGTYLHSHSLKRAKIVSSTEPKTAFVKTETIGPPFRSFLTVSYSKFSTELINADRLHYNCLNFMGTTLPAYKIRHIL
jgi:hypothetical protein